VLHHTYEVLEHKSPGHHPMEVLQVLSLQSIVQPIIQSIQKAILLLLISVHFIGSIARQLSKLGDILIHRHGPLFQILELLLQLDYSMGNMVCMQSSSKFWPLSALEFLMGFHVSIPLVICRTKKLVRG
jgi:hypothetical protein